MKDFFTSNRERTMEHMLDSSIALVPSNPPLTTNGDSVLRYVPNTNLYYLSGIDQEETLLLLIKKNSTEQESILYIKEKDPSQEIWNGNLLSTEQATAISGATEVRTIDKLASDLHSLILESSHIYFLMNEHPRAQLNSPLAQALGSEHLDYANSIIAGMKKKYPLHQYHRLTPILNKLRTIKHPYEIDLIRKAISITDIGLRSTLKQFKTFGEEREIEALLTYEFRKNGATGVTGFSYSPIVAAGLNSCTLHYITNREKIPSNSLVLLDVGAEYHYYPADITRCFPTSGVFPQRIKDVYSAVLRVLKKASTLIQIGGNFKDYTQQVAELVGEELAKLRLIPANQVKNPSSIKKYFMHGPSHFLGLEVHDVGNYQEPFKKGMVLTCEPGIYIPEEKIGIRLENDLLLTENGCENLSVAIPIEVDEIESLINS